MSAVFFVIVAVHADGGNDFSNTLLRVQAEEPAGRIIFVNQIYLQVFCTIRGKQQDCRR